MHIVMDTGHRFLHRFITHGRYAECGQVLLLMQHGLLGHMFSWQGSTVQLSHHDKVLAIDLPGITRCLSLQTMLDEIIITVSSLRLVRFDWRSLSVPVRFFWSRNDCIEPLLAPHAFPLEAELSISEARGDIPHLWESEWLKREMVRFLISKQTNSA